jgi:RNA polymerase sigma-70 factor (ECF subfamily)
MVRRRARRQVAVSDRIAAEPTHTVGESEAVTSGLVEVALAALSEPDREILSLSVWEDLDREAIAVVLGCSKANVSVRLHRARRRFAEEFERQSRTSRPRLHPATFPGGVDA